MATGRFRRVLAYLSSQKDVVFTGVAVKLIAEAVVTIAAAVVLYLAHGRLIDLSCLIIDWMREPLGVRTGAFVSLLIVSLVGGGH